MQERTINGRSSKADINPALISSQLQHLSQSETKPFCSNTEESFWKYLICGLRELYLWKVDMTYESVNTLLLQKYSWLCIDI